MALLNFDASTVAPDTGAQDPVPAGWYDVVIDASEMKPTNDGNGSYLELRHNIIAGAMQGRKVYGRLNLRNANPTAQEIGYKQLSAVCHSTGVIQCQDSAQLHNIPLKIKVKLRPADGKYEASNEITAWKNIKEVVQMAAATAGGFPGQAAASPAPAPFAPPPQAAPMAPPQFQQPAPQMAAPQMQQQTTWQPPAAQQPWQQGAAAPAAAPAAPAPQFQAPQAAPQFAPAPAAQPQPQQQAQPAQEPQQQAAPAPAAAPWNGAQAAVPPWMQPQQ